MADYRRLISYIYEYEGKEKGKNAGFVKLEARNGQCRLNVNVKRMYMGGNAMGVYLLNGENRETFLGNMFVRGGNGEFRALLDMKNVDGHGAGMEEYCGLTVHDVKNSWRSYRTIWEDAAMPEEEKEEAHADEPWPDALSDSAGKMKTAMEILPGVSDVPLQAVSDVVKEIEAEIQREEERREEERKQEEESTESRTESWDPVREDGNLGAKMPTLQAAEMPTEDSEKEEKDEMKTDRIPPGQQVALSPELENPEVLQYLQETEDLAADPERLWTELRKSYPKIQPFDYEDGCEILTIRPQDIGRLPRETWIYGNNSFLLHGYYNFRYLILVRLGGKEGKARYLLGVPGHYYSSEKYMASMFGFPNFVLSKKQPPNDGRFGYWYVDMRIRQS